MAWKSILFVLGAILIAAFVLYVFKTLGPLFGVPSLGIGILGFLGITSNGKGGAGVGGDGDGGAENRSIGDARDEYRRADEAAKRGLERLDGIKAEIDGHDSIVAGRFRRESEIIDESRRIFRKEPTGTVAEDDSD